MLPPGTRRWLRQAVPRLRAGRGDCTERASSRPLSPNLIAPLAFTPDFAQTGFRKSSLFYYPRLADACCTNTVLDTFRFTFVLPLVTKQLLSIKCLKTSFKGKIGCHGQFKIIKFAPKNRGTFSLLI